MTLRGNPIERDATLPDGTVVHVRVGVPHDSYIAERDLDTVSLELSSDEEHLAAVNTLLDVAQESEAHALAAEVVEGLESGRLEPTAGALGPLADSLPGR